MRSLTGNIPPLRGIVRAGLVAIVAAVVANLVA
jgi:hypothetical protein